MTFEWDSNKSVLNQQKHGIGFSEAQLLWSDSNLMILPSRFPAEPRLLAIGTINHTYYTAIFTERGEKIRIISVRRSRDNEQNLHEQNHP